MDKVISTYRRRIMKAALDRHQRKTGSTCIVISLPKGGITTLELTEILIDGLLCRFEKLALSEYGSVDGQKSIRELYQNSIDVNGRGEYLTEGGKLLVDDLITEVVTHVKNNSTVSTEKP